MAHIFGFGDKVVTDNAGTLYDSGGPGAPYNANESDYFIIRRTDHASNTHVFFIIEEWSVPDVGVATHDYDYIDVYQTAAGNMDPTSWTWVERLGGTDVQSGGELAAGSLPATFYLEAEWIKFVFKSAYRQNYDYSGFKINWHTGVSGDTTGYDDLDAAGSTTYTDEPESRIKENAMDSEVDVNSDITTDPATTNWDFMPVGQFGEKTGITILNHKFTNMNYQSDANMVPLSYTSPERLHLAQQVGNITIEDDQGAISIEE